MMKLKELTGYHSPVTGSGRSLPPLGAIHTICDPPLHLNMFDYMSALESIWKHIDLITSNLTFSYRKGNAWCVTKNHNTRTVSNVLSLKKIKKRTVSSVKYIMPLTMKTFTTQLFLFLAIFFHCHKYANKSKQLNNLLTHTFQISGKFICILTYYLVFYIFITDNFKAANPKLHVKNRLVFCLSCTAVVPYFQSLTNTGTGC